MSENHTIAEEWFKSKGWSPFKFQRDCWGSFLAGKSGLLNAPTGSGKTYALWIPCILDFLRENQKHEVLPELRVLWITPLRALGKDLRRAMQEFCDDIGLPWQVGLRTGDTTASERKKQKTKIPQALVTTPESLHVLLASKDNMMYFRNIRAIIVDEWHELIGTKRGVATELVINRIKHITSAPKLSIWGISATIGNLTQAKRVLLGEDLYQYGATIIAGINKKIEVKSILPDEVERFPWHGHLGTKLASKIIPIIKGSRTTLLFTNTRSQTELWYQAILKEAPDLAGTMAMHHGSMDHDIRQWVEDALHEGKLKLVVCTSSLDLGVDFRPVDVVVQVGGPKGISRFQQRAGRSGHQPGQVSRIYFVPTNSLELIEAAALREAIAWGKYESRKPMEKSMDVLVQYLVTLAVGGGFKTLKILEELKKTYCYRLLTSADWRWALNFITTGGKTLGEYDEYAKVYEDPDGIYRIINRKSAMRHRLSIGTIVGDPSMKVRFITGGYLGTIEEYFISKLNPGDHFWFAGQNLKFIQIKDLTVLVRKSKKKSGVTPAWGGGRLPLSSLLADRIKSKLDEATKGTAEEIEMTTIQPILDLQGKWSRIPDSSILLIEKTETNFGHHVIIFPFEGMFVHELLGGVIALRIGRYQRHSFSISMNDYGFELLSDQEIFIEEALELDLFSEDGIMEDIIESLNQTELTQRKFRDVATIAGLIFQGYPGKDMKAKHLQASSDIIFKAFSEYDPENLLLKQAMEEVMTNEMEQTRLLEAFRRINKLEIVVKNTEKPSPFAFPIIVDSVRRQNLSTEDINDRIAKMQVQLEQYAQGHA